MINPDLQRVIQGALQEVRSYDPPWEQEDIFYSACGAALKYAESHGQDGADNPELIAAIQATVRNEMEKS